MPGIGRVDGDDRLAHGRRLDGHLAGSADEGAELAGQTDRDAHDAATSWWKRSASSAASSDGLIVELTVAVSTMASRVLRP